MNTRHHNIIDSSGRVYCYKHDTLAVLDVKYHRSYCRNCDYFYDDMQNTGVVCYFDDKCNEIDVMFDDAGDSELHCKMQYVRLGMKTKEQVLRTLKSYNNYDEESENKEGKEDEAPSPEEKNEEEK